MMIETIQDDHSYNMDELLSYLVREGANRRNLSIANIRCKERYLREKTMADNYQRMYEAAQFYRKN